MKHKPIVIQCLGCDRVDNDTCTAFYFPAVKWSRGNCPYATHLTKREGEPEQKINPLKASKRSRGK